LGVRESARRHGQADATTTRLFGVVFGPAALLGYFSSKMSKELSSLSSERYRVMLNEFLLPKFEEEDTDDILFQQDGASCHTANATIDLLRTVFENRMISRNADVNWPPCSCDLTPLDYFLWGTVKDEDVTLTRNDSRIKT